MEINGMYHIQFEVRLMLDATIPGLPDLTPKRHADFYLSVQRFPIVWVNQ